MSSKFQIIALFGWLGACFATAWVGSRFEPGPWYFQLQKPSWTPPGYLFGPVWTFLYATMGVAAWLVWKRAGFSGAKLALSVFIAQLILNALWSWIFFGLHKPDLAFAEILLLWTTILATTVIFWQQYTPAGLLFVPYLIWVTFAAILNGAIWRMNK